MSNASFEHHGLPLLSPPPTFDMMESCCGAHERAVGSLRDHHCRDRAAALHGRAPRHLAWCPLALRSRPATLVSGVHCVSSSARSGTGGARLAEEQQPQPHHSRPLPPLHSVAVAHDTAGSVHSIFSTAQPLQWPPPTADDGAETGGVPAPEDWHRQPALLSG